MAEEDTEHTRKELCPECGAAVKVPAGQKFADVHNHPKGKDQPPDVKRGDTVETAGASAANATQRRASSVSDEASKK